MFRDFRSEAFCGLNSFWRHCSLCVGLHCHSSCTQHQKFVSIIFFSVWLSADEKHQDGEEAPARSCKACSHLAAVDKRCPVTLESTQRQVSGKEQSGMTQNGQHTVKLHLGFGPCHVSFNVTRNTFLIL